MKRIKNILITGEPGVGKTTLLKEVIGKVSLSAGGFYTEEIREKGERKGFKIITLEGEEGVLALKGLKSRYTVGSYGVNLENLESVGVKAILKAIDDKELVLIDEIGKMELFSHLFKEAVTKALDSPRKVLATIKKTQDTFTRKIRNRSDTVVLELKPTNREEVKKEVIQLLFE